MEKQLQSCFLYAKIMFNLSRSRGSITLSIKTSGFPLSAYYFKLLKLLENQSGIVPSESESIA